MHWNSHGAAGSRGRPCERCRAREYGLQAGRQVRPRRQARRRRPRGRRLGQGQLRLPDDVLRADLRSRRRADRRHRQPGRAPKMAGYIPSHTDTYSGEGSQVISMDTPVLQGRAAGLPERVVPELDQRHGRHDAVDVCDPIRRRSSWRAPATSPRRTARSPAASRRPAPTRRTRPSPGRDKETGKVFVVLVDDMEEPDVDILDITNPAKPKLVSETNLDQFAQFGPTPAARRLRVQPRHDRQAHRRPRHDAHVLLGRRLRHARRERTRRRPKALSDTDFKAADPARAKFGGDDQPEGNAHQAEFTRDNKFFFATDEDFNPYRVQATFKGGPAAERRSRPSRDRRRSRSTRTTRSPATPQFVGLGCDALPPAAAGARSPWPSAARATSRSSSTTPSRRATRA